MCRTREVASCETLIDVSIEVVVARVVRFPAEGSVHEICGIESLMFDFNHTRGFLVNMSRWCV